MIRFLVIGGILLGAGGCFGSRETSGLEATIETSRVQGVYGGQPIDLAISRQVETESERSSRIVPPPIIQAAPGLLGALGPWGEIAGLVLAAIGGGLAPSAGKRLLKRKDPAKAP